MSKKKRPIRGENVATLRNRTTKSSDIQASISFLSDWRLSYISLALVALVFIVFGQTIRHGFINYDDNTLVAENVHIIKGLSLESLRWALTVGSTASDPTLAYRGSVDNDYWRPVSLISHMLDVHFFGLRPGWHHLVNLLIHALASVGLFLTLFSMTGRLWRSALVAALFAIHPLHVESVAWVAERKDVLSGLFFMLTLWAYAHYVHKASPKPEKRFPWCAYLLVLIFCALAMMSKPMVVTLPCVLLLFDYWPLDRIGKIEWLKLLIEKVPLFAMAFALAWITTQGAGSLSPGMMHALSLPWRLGNAVTSYALYLKQAFWPTGLSVFYHHPGRNLPMMTLGLSMVLLLVISGGVVWQWRKRYLAVGWFWYLGMLVPVIGIIQSGDQARADRYTYLPLIGIFIMVVWFVADWSHDVVGREVRRNLRWGAVAALAVLAAISYRQVSFWHDSKSLWKHALACTFDNEVACNNLGTIIEKEGRPEEAFPYFAHAVRIDPSYAYAHNNLGLCLVKMGKRKEAISEFRAALRFNPYYGDAYSNLGSALMEEGKSEEALEYLKKGLALNPESPYLHYNMGMDLMALGRSSESATAFEEVLRRDSEFQDVQHQVGKALLQLGRRKEAIEHLENAHRDDPSSTEVMNDLAWALATSPEENLRNGSRALKLAQEADKATGGSNPYILDTLAAAYAETGNYSEAIKRARRALELADKDGIKELAESLVKEKESYQQEKAWRDKNKF